MMVNLRDILYKVNLTSVTGELDVDIRQVCYDSGKVKKGDCFVAIKGVSNDGHDFIEEAVKAGASAVICEKLPGITRDETVYVTVKDTATALGIISANFCGNPADKLSLVGVTGTNGKTSVVTLLHQLYQLLGYKVGLISTVVYRVGDEEIPASHTTPDAVQLNGLLHQMVEAGCTHCFVEVSSHAVVQGRVAGLRFKVAIFTNITHDHLDYHQTFDNYIGAKKALFDSLQSDAIAIVNVDDKRGKVVLQNCKAEKKTMAIKSMADFNAKVITNSLEGIELEIEGRPVWFRLVGGFNAYNLLAVYACAITLGEESDVVLTKLSALKGAPGRMERIPPFGRFTALVDYAHTPDALENVMETISSLRPGDVNIIAVVGCGGDRDKHKRPLMASIACKHADKVVITTDNPRYEDPILIIKEMQSGISPKDVKKTLVIPDREEAIKSACMMAQENDIVLIAGKGHEAFQEIKGVKHPFDDRKVVHDVLKLFVIED